VPCGSVGLYCPPESLTVTAVTSGFYTTPEMNDTLTIREGKEVCPAGFACNGGIKSECVAGLTYQPETSKSSCLKCSTYLAGIHKTLDCITNADTTYSNLDFPVTEKCRSNVQTALSVRQAQAFAHHATLVLSQKSSEKVASLVHPVPSQDLPPSWAQIAKLESSHQGPLMKSARGKSTSPVTS